MIGDIMLAKNRGGIEKMKKLFHRNTPNNATKRWKKGINYTVGDVVRYKKDHFVAVVSHSSSNSVTPLSVPENWRQMPPPAPAPVTS